MNRLSRINEEIRNNGFASLNDDDKRYKAKDIWEKRNKKNLWANEFKDADKFIDWYLSIDKRICACCGVEEDFVRKYFYENEYNIQFTRNKTRGHILELDKIDSKPGTTIEKYDKDNCQLLCYLCNNAKSNVCNDNASFIPIAEGIRNFWNNQR